jgi:DNA-binding CsgD family transcriptional regulator
MDRVSQLTARQRDCLRLVLQHSPSKEIARTLAISPNTVDQHIRAAMTSLGVSSRVAAAKLLMAYEAQLHPQPLTSPSLGMAEPEPFEHCDVTFGEQEAGTAKANASEIPEMELSEEWVENRVRDYQTNHFSHHQEMVPSAYRSVIPWDGRRQNDLTTFQRLGWIAIISIGTTLAFGVMLASLDALSRLT